MGDAGGRVGQCSSASLEVGGVRVVVWCERAERVWMAERRSDSAVGSAEHGAHGGQHEQSRRSAWIGWVWGSMGSDRGGLESLTKRVGALYGICDRHRETGFG